jgi:hypothetical protein
VPTRIIEQDDELDAEMHAEMPISKYANPLARQSGPRRVA